MLITARIVGFVLLLVLVSAKLSKSYLPQGGDDYAAQKWNIVVAKTKVDFTRTQNISENKIRGRKMMSDYNSRKIDETMKEVRVRRKDPRKSRILISRENHQARFVAFNADYKGPRHHPPKNN